VRGYRLFADVSSVAVEWRVLGFRLRTLLVLWVFFWIFVGGAVTMWSGLAGTAILLGAAALAFMFVVYVNRNDPELVLRETTMLRLLWSGNRHRIRTNDPVRD
jgi:hypothetical protein